MSNGRRKPRALYFGQLALKYRYIDLQQLEECLGVQEEFLARGEMPPKLGKVMVERGFLTEAQARKLFELQGREGGPQEVAGYEVYGPIGNGGMGTVYKARHVSTDRTVALKILLPRLARDIEYVKRFVREARAAAMLDHPNIVSGIDVGGSNGLYYFAMEFVDGPTLTKLLRREGRLEERRSLTITLRIAEALAHAAERGIVHGDVKPGNVILADEAAPKLCDLGLARRANAALQGVAMGTPSYAAPEQVRGEEVLDSRADTYALGATLFHMVTGHHPFYGTTSRILSQQVYSKARAPRELNSHISVACDRLILRMMATQKEDRYADPADVVREIRAVLDPKDTSGEFCQFAQRRAIKAPVPTRDRERERNRRSFSSRPRRARRR